MPNRLARPDGMSLRNARWPVIRVCKLDAVTPAPPMYFVICPMTRGSARLRSDVAEERVTPADEEIQSVIALVRPPSTDSSIGRAADVRFARLPGDASALEMSGGFVSNLLRRIMSTRPVAP